MKAVWNGIVIAESEETVYLEGNHYFPPEGIDARFMRPSALRTLCLWKGIASYYTIEAGGASSRHAAWTYRRPFPWIRKIRGRVAFSEPVEVRH